MKSSIIKFVLAALILPACSLKRSEDARLRININDNEGRPVRQAFSGGRNAADLFDANGHSRSSIDLSAAPGAACFFVGILGSNIKSSMQGKSMSGIKDTCATFSEMGQVSELVSFSQLQQEGVSLTLSVGSRAFTLYAINLEGYDANTGCPAKSLDQVTAYDPFAKVFAFAKGEATLDRQTTQVTLTQVSAQTLESLVPVSCYDAAVKAPVSLSATAISTTQADLAWTDASSNESGFYVDRSLDGFSNWTRIATVSPNVTSYSDTSLSSNTTYYFRVTAYNLAGEESSSIVSVTTNANVVSVPTGLDVVPMSTSLLSVTWDISTTNDYELFRAVDSGDYELVQTILKNTVNSYADSASITSDTIYHYKLRAKGADASYSSFTSVVTGYSYPNAPSNVTVTANSVSELSVSWVPNSTRHTAFVVQKSLVANSGFSPYATTAANATSVNVSGLSAGTRYYFRVYAVNPGGDSDYSSTGSGYTKLATPVMGDVTTASATQVTVSWGAVANALSYTLKYRKDSDGTWTSVGDITATTTNVTVVADTLYHFKVFAVNGAEESPESNIKDYTLTSGLSAPTIISIEGTSSTSLKVIWGGVSGATSYGVYYRKQGDGAWVFQGTATDTFMVVGSLLEYTYYDFNVVAMANGQADSAPSTTQSERTLLGKPSQMAITSLTDTSLTVNWITGVTGAESYKVEIEDVSSGNLFADPTGLTSGTKTFTGLTPNREYATRVYAYTNANGYSEASNEIVTRTKTIGATISTITKTGPNEFTLAWDAVDGATKYKIEHKASGASSWENQESTSSPWAVNGLTDGTAYDFRIYSYSDSTGLYSDPGPVRSATMNSVSEPTSLDATPISGDAIQLTWTAASGADNYRVLYRKSGSIGVWSVAEGASGLVITSLDEDSLYNFKVYSLVSGTPSVDFATIDETTYLDTPIGVATTLDSTSEKTIRLAWTVVSARSARVAIFRSTDGSTPPASLDEVDTTSTYSDTTAVPGHSYVYYVKNIGAAGANISALSNASAALTPILFKPTGLVADATLSSSSIKLSWVDNSIERSSYLVVRKADGESLYVNHAIVINAPFNEYTDSAITVGVGYSYKVYAQDSNGNISEASNATPTVATTAASNKVTNFRVDSAFTTMTGLRLRWTDPTPDNNYRLQMKYLDALTPAFSDVTTHPASNSDYLDVSGLVSGGRYVFRIYAIYSGVQGDVSDEASATLSDGQPTGLAVTSTTDTTATLTWNTVAGNTGYEIGFSPDGSTWNSTFVAANSVTATISSLGIDTQYHFRIHTVFSSSASSWTTPITAATGAGWTRIATSADDADAPEGRFGHTAVWTGSKMIVWGGKNVSGFYLASGAIYDPEGTGDNAWKPMADVPAGFAARAFHSAVWTGSVMIVFGGTGPSINYPYYTTLSTCAMFDPNAGANGTWTELNTTGQNADALPEARTRHTAVWADTRMLVFGGDPSGTGTLSITSGLSLNLAAGGIWTALPSLSNSTYSIMSHQAFWTGDIYGMVAFGGRADAANYRSNLVFYNDGAFTADEDEEGAFGVTGRSDFAAVSTGSQMIVWGGEHYNTGSSTLDRLSTGARYTYGGSWTNLPASPLAARSNMSVAWAGSTVKKMLIWGGMGSSGSPYNDGAYFSNDADTWVPLPTTNALNPREGATAVWTGTDFIVFGGSHGSGVYADGAKLKVGVGLRASGAHPQEAPEVEEP